MKEYIKKSKIWIQFSHSELYTKLTKPERYKHYLGEVTFVKKMFNNHTGGVNLIFDVGANVGFKTQQFLKVAKKVVVFEPNEKMLAILKARFSNNTSVIIENVALNNQETDLDFFVVQDRESLSSLSTKHIEDIVKGRFGIANDRIITHTIKTSTLDNFIVKYGVPDYIKIDVEGFEFEVVKGLSKLVPLLSVEVNLPQFLNETIQIIDRLVFISNNSYVYNVSSNEELLLENFLPATEITEYLKNTNRRYLELYARLM